MKRAMALAGITAAAFLSLGAPAGAAVTETVDGTTCTSDYRNTAGWTDCRGGDGTWRLWVECDYQGDYTSSWKTGSGQKAFECWNKATGAGVDWK